MPFAILFNFLAPLLVAAIKALLPWLIDKITADIAAGRHTVIETAEIKRQINYRKEDIRKEYRNAD